MAYLIECDRCGETRTVKGSSACAPKSWLQFNEMWLGDGGIDVIQKPIEGGVFCERCVKALRDWREPVPRAMPDKGI